MKTATEFGIKYLRTLPDGRQTFVMHQNIWRDRNKAQEMVENLKGVVACPMLVEIWDPVEIEALNEMADRPDSVCPVNCRGNCLKAEEQLPEAEQEQPSVEVPDHLKVNKSITYISHPDGSVTVKVDGKDITDPEQQAEARKSMGEIEMLWKLLDNLLRDRNVDLKQVLGDPRMFLWDPSQAPTYSNGGEYTGHTVRQTSTVAEA